MKFVPQTVLGCALVLTALILMPAASPDATADEGRAPPLPDISVAVQDLVESHEAALAELDATYRDAVRRERAEHAQRLHVQLDEALQREDLGAAFVASEALGRAMDALETARVITPAADDEPRILEARWGMGTRWKDVTERVTDYLDRGLEPVVNHRSLGDPAPRWKKTLFVAYSVAGELRVHVVAEDRRLRLP